VIKEGDVIEIKDRQKSKRKTNLPTRNNPISIFFEDDFLIVALKPAGILSCGSKEEKVNYSFHKELEEFLTKREDKKVRLWVVHRIDREVEGLILFAKSEKIQIKIKENWENVIKKYLALCEHKPKLNHGTIENWLKDSSTQKVIEYSKEVRESKFAKTEYTFLRQEKSYFLLEIKLHTGRKNQIRVHLSGIGCPIVGDRKYGAEANPVRQIRLAAFQLVFDHPVNGKLHDLRYNPSAAFFNPSQKKDEKYKIL
jgi:23S rRNA-/tRNA-specific pseudouridylate synthase